MKKKRNGNSSCMQNGVPCVLGITQPQRKC